MSADARTTRSGGADPVGGRTTRALLATVRLYQQAISPMRPASCRYTPTCSTYAVTAIERFGPARGSWLALRRLLRCHPFHRGGHDPVPSHVGRRDGRDGARGVLPRPPELPTHPVSATDPPVYDLPVIDRNVA